MKKILIVEDDRLIAELERDYLEASEYEVELAMDGFAGMKLVREQEYDLIILDVMLPGVSGFEICREIRKTKDIPVIMVTAKGSEYDKVVGLDSGADDYVTKPFGMMELVSRIKAVMRRAGKVEDRMDMDISGVHVNVKKHEVTVEGKEVSLTLKEFELLEKLMRNQGIVLTRDQLLTEIWGYDFDGETRTVDVHIRTLRQKLGDHGDLIQTVRGVGYRVGGSA